MTMQRIITLAVGLLVFVSLVATAAAREDDDGPMNKKKCEEMGGVWHNEAGQKYCATWQAVDDDDGVVTDDGIVDLGEFVARVRTTEFPRLVLVVYSQHGNIGAPGTGEPTIETQEVERFVETTLLECFKQLPNGRLQEMPLGPCEAAMNR